MKIMLSIQKDAPLLLKKLGAWLLFLFAIIFIYNLPVYAADKVSLQLRWDHQFQFAGYYCAQWQGYYAEEGLEVTILPGVTEEGILEATEEVIAGRADFGIGGADILKANEDTPLVVLATILQQSGAGFFALPGTDLQTPADFTRLRVARNIDDLIDLELQALLKTEGIDPSTVVAYPHQAGLDHLLNGGVEVIPGLSLSLPYNAALNGQPLIFMSSSDFGINFYGDSLFTTHEFLSNNENLVKRFRRASLRGWQYALDHPKETAAQIAEELERTTKLPDALAFNMNQSKEVVALTDYPIVDVGHINPARWQRMHGYLRDLGILEKEIKLEDFIYDPAQYELRRVEKLQKLLLYGVLFSGLCILFALFWNAALKRKVKAKTAELKESYAALQASEEIFSNVFQNAPLLMSLSRIEDGKFYDVNDAFVKATGYEREQIIGASSVELGFLDADARKILQKKLEKTGRVRGLELTSKRADGTTMICDYSGIILSIAGKQLLLSIASDITYRRQMENELVTQAENLNTLFNAIPSILILLDEQGQVEKINTEGSWSASGDEDDFKGQLAGNSLNCIHAAEEIACGSTASCRDCPVRDCFSKTLASGKPCVDTEGEMAFKTGDNTVRRNVLISSRLLVIGGERKILLVMNDITRLKETEKERHELEVQLNQAQKLESIGRLAGGVAHDMNNLLAPIIGYGEMLGEDLSAEDPRRDSADQIVTAANKATVLIRQLLAFSRKQSLEFKPLNLNVLLRNFEKLIRRTLREDIFISITLAPELPEIEGDAGQLEQVVMNLAVNAQDAMPDGGELEFITEVTDFDNDAGKVAESKLQGKRVTLIVRDNGVGIDKEILDHIFEPFFTTKEQDKGTGLGLASVYGIVRQHKGDIVVSSTAQEGTTFKMYFPIAQVLEKREEMPERTGSPEEGYGTILVVEDDDGLRKIVVAMLKRKGYTPLTAADGEEALALLANTEVKIDLLLTDVVMPTMSGRKLALRVAREYGDIKTLYMSGYNDEIMEYQDLDSTRERFIEKPFSMNALIEKVQDMLA